MTLTVKHPFTSAIADDPTAAAAGQVLPSHWNANHTVTGSVDATQMPALTGDVTTSAGAVATTLATVNSNVGTFGDSTHVAQVTVNGKGLVTAASSVAISVSASPPGSNTQVAFNDSGSFGATSGLTFDKTNAKLSIVSTQSPGVVQLDIKNSALSGTPGFTFSPLDGGSQLKLYQGNSGGGFRVTDYNGQDLFALGSTVAFAAWTVLGTGTSATIGDLVVNNDNTYSIGSSAKNVKAIYQYTGYYKPVAVASLPTGSAGMVAAVNDASAPSVGATVSAGGAAFALVCHNGTAWKVMSI